MAILEGMVDDPGRGPRGLVLGFLGALLLWILIAIAAITGKRIS